MENNINNNKHSLNNMYKKLTLMIFTFLFLMSSANSTTFFDNQNAIINEINNLDLQNTILPEILIGGNIATNNMGYTISLTTEPLYLGFYSQTGNNTQIEIHYTLNVGGNNLVKLLNITPNEVYYVKFTPQGDNDYANFQVFTFENNSRISYSIFNVNDNGRGFSDVTNVMIGSMTDLIQINIGFWKLVYYLFIFSIIIGGIGLLVNFAFKLYDWADRTSDKKKEIFSGGHHNSRRDK